MNGVPGGDYYLAFDIEAVPDVESGRRLHGLEGLDDEDTVRAMEQLRMQETGGRTFLRLYLYRVVAISGVLRRRVLSGESDDIRIWSIGDPDADEKELIERFFRLIERREPTLISWNGNGFDMPVLIYRALHHGVEAARYFDTRSQDFRFNNYQNRYHERHTDLMDVLAGHQNRAAAPLDEVARFLGVPGKSDMSGEEVGERWLAGDIEAIRDYCEADALRTWLVYLHYDRLRGRLDADAFEHELALVREAVREREHLLEFAGVGAST